MPSSRRPRGEPDTPNPVLDEQIQRAVNEKVRVLQFLRAFGCAGIDPRLLRAVRGPLVRVVEHDHMLTALIEILDRLGAEAEMPVLEEDMYAALWRELRGNVLDALEPPQRADLLSWIEDVPAHEREVWLQVDKFRRAAKSGRLTGDLVLESDAQARELGDAIYGREIEEVRDPRLVRQEAKALPRRSRLPAWLRALPVGWLRVIARMHGVRADGKKDDLVATIAERLLDRDALAALVADVLGPLERTRMAYLAAAGRMQLAHLTPDDLDDLAVTWEWETVGVPYGAMSRLRCVGLAFVGQWAGEPVVAMPEELRAVVLELIATEYPDIQQALDGATRALAAASSTALPYDDPELARWKDADMAATKHILVASGRAGEAAVDAFFHGGRRAIEEEEGAYLIEYSALAWREGPGAMTAIEQHLRHETDIAPDERAVLEATAASRPSLYQVVSVDPPRGAMLADLFHGGEPVFVDDRAFSLQAEPGYIVPGRVYAAGPFRFFRACGGVLAADEEAAALAWLEDRCAANRDRTGHDRERYLADQSQDLWHVVRRVRGTR